MNKLNGLLRISVATILTSMNLLFLYSQEKIGKEIHESFEVNSNTHLSISNRYGNIDIRNWDKKSVDIKVQVKLFDLTEKESEEILRMIYIRNNSEGNKIAFKTEIEDGFNKSLMRISKGDKKFEINYVVNMPHSIPVDISNKYGSVFVDRLSSPSKLAVQYGKLKANNINSVTKDPMTEVALGYSEGNIEECQWLKVNIKYSKLKIEESKALIILSKYSKIYITRGSSLVTEAKYDTYEVGTLANFVSEVEYSNLRFKSIGKKLQIESQYTDVKIGYMPASFELIKISNRYGSYKIGIEDGASYKLKGIAKYGNISYPENSRVNRFQETTELKIEGLVGPNAQTNSKVFIETKYGSIKLED